MIMELTKRKQRELSVMVGFDVKWAGHITGHLMRSTTLQNEIFLSYFINKSGSNRIMHSNIDWPIT